MCFEWQQRLPGARADRPRHRPAGSVPRSRVCLAVLRVLRVCSSRLKSPAAGRLALHGSPVTSASVVLLAFSTETNSLCSLSCGDVVLGCSLAAVRTCGSTTPCRCSPPRVSRCAFALPFRCCHDCLLVSSICACAHSRLLAAPCPGLVWWLGCVSVGSASPTNHPPRCVLPCITLIVGMLDLRRLRCL